MLSQLEKLGINIGLYRDDGLATCNKTPRPTENIKKKYAKSSKENKLKITIKANKKIVDFLDITMDLRTGEHKSYMIPNNTPLHVHKKATTHQTLSKTSQKASTEDYQTFHLMKTYSKRRSHLTKTPSKQADMTTN